MAPRKTSYKKRSARRRAAGSAVTSARGNFEPDLQELPVRSLRPDGSEAPRASVSTPLASSDPLLGFRIVDIAHLIGQIMNDRHDGGCSFMNSTFVREDVKEFQSTYVFRCSICAKETLLDTDPTANANTALEEPELYAALSSLQQEQARNKDQEKEILEWIEAVLGEKLPSAPYEDVLKDGVVLCNLINKIAPGSVNKIQTKGTNFQLMENVQRFQAGIKKYGVPQEEIFQTADLFERRNIPQVTLCLFALGRLTQKHPEYKGPPLGPKMAEKNEREFTEEQLRAHEGQLNLQMGYNKGASQSGHGGFGNTRHM